MGEFSPSFRTNMHLTLYNVKVLTKWPFSEQQERDMNLFFMGSANDYEYIFSLFSRIKLTVNPEGFLIGLAQYYPIGFDWLNPKGLKNTKPAFMHVADPCLSVEGAVLHQGSKQCKYEERSLFILREISIDENTAIVPRRRHWNQANVLFSPHN